MAIDGDPATAWTVGEHADPVGETLRLRFETPVAGRSRSCSPTRRAAGASPRSRLEFAADPTVSLPASDPQVDRRSTSRPSIAVAGGHRPGRRHDHGRRRAASRSPPARCRPSGSPRSSPGSNRRSRWCDRRSTASPSSPPTPRSRSRSPGCAPIRWTAGATTPSRRSSARSTCATPASFDTGGRRPARRPRERRRAGRRVRLAGGGVDAAHRLGRARRRVRDRRRPRHELDHRRSAPPSGATLRIDGVAGPIDRISRAAAGERLQHDHRAHRPVRRPGADRRAGARRRRHRRRRRSTRRCRPAPSRSWSPAIEPATTLDRRFGDPVELPAAIAEIALPGLPAGDAGRRRRSLSVECAPLLDVDGAALDASVTLTGRQAIDGDRRGRRAVRTDASSWRPVRTGSLARVGRPAAHGRPGGARLDAPVAVDACRVDAVPTRDRRRPTVASTAPSR